MIPIRASGRPSPYDVGRGIRLVTLEIVVAVAENGIIGRDNGLPWRLSRDLKHFRELTTGHAIVMGRNTWESIGRALPGRTSIVVTSRPDLPVPEGVLRAGSLDEALERVPPGQRIFVIGGARLYAEALPRADVLHWTTVHGAPDGDVRFPALAAKEWTVAAEETHAADSRNEYPVTFRRLERKRS